MKLIGLMPFRDPAKEYPENLAHLESMCDHVILLADNPSVCPKLPPQAKKVEVCLIDSGLEWNDYQNRLTLLARAAAHGGNVVLWLDDDELLQVPTLDLPRIQAQEMIDTGHVAVRYKVKEMWNQTQFRTDGIWNNKGRILLQDNPFISDSILLTSLPDARFHQWPLQVGPIMEAKTGSILHYGMCTEELRKARVAKWKFYDLENKYQSQGYEYLTDESGIELKDL